MPPPHTHTPSFARLRRGAPVTVPSPTFEPWSIQAPGGIDAGSCGGGLYGGEEVIDGGFVVGGIGNAVGFAGLTGSGGKSECYGCMKNMEKEKKHSWETQVFPLERGSEHLWMRPTIRF